MVSISCVSVEVKVVADWQPTMEVCSELPLWQAAAETSLFLHV